MAAAAAAAGDGTILHPVNVLGAIELHPEIVRDRKKYLLLPVMLPAKLEAGTSPSDRWLVAVRVCCNDIDVTREYEVLNSPNRVPFDMLARGEPLNFNKATALTNKKSDRPRGPDSLWLHRPLGPPTQSLSQLPATVLYIKAKQNAKTAEMRSAVESAVIIHVNFLHFPYGGDVRSDIIIVRTKESTSKASPTLLPSSSAAAGAAAAAPAAAAASVAAAAASGVKERKPSKASSASKKKQTGADLDGTS